jgi:hypothetical protein
MARPRGIPSGWEMMGYAGTDIFAVSPLDTGSEDDLPPSDATGNTKRESTATPVSAGVGWFVTPL